MRTDDLIETICRRCRYYKRSCFYDYGDSLTIPCKALVKLYELSKFLLSRESDIALEMEDFGCLKELFVEIFGREPST